MSRSAALGLAVVSGLEPRAESSSRDEAEVRAVIERWAEAVRRRDYEGIVARHSDTFVMFDVPPPLQSVGLAAYRRTWDVFFQWAGDPVVFAIDDMAVVAGADVAFAVARMHCAGSEPAGERSELAFRLTVGLKKIDGTWTIVHEHHSIPAG